METPTLPNVMLITGEFLLPALVHVTIPVAVITQAVVIIQAVATTPLLLVVAARATAVTTMEISFARAIRK